MDWFKYLIIPAVISFFGIILYRRVAISKDIVANPNFRNLHTRPIPVGGGIVFSFVFVFSLFFLWWLNQISDDLFWALAVGGVLTALFGFLDDLKDIRASIKLVAQFFLSGWLLFWVDGGPLLSIDWIPVLVAIPVTALFLVWMINAYNFVDGIDGMAVSGAVFVSGAIALVLLLTNGNSEFFLVFVLFLASTSTFLFFNWPPASIFMG
ncbi:hypothetical protein N9357_05815, partial [bacterium]|nr:hypothetical protein [bacterium]